MFDVYQYIFVYYEKLMVFALFSSCVSPTVDQELEKLAARKLKISAQQAMKIAEKLYTQGWVCRILQPMRTNLIINLVV